MQKKTNTLVSLIERHKKWKIQQAIDETESEEENDSKPSSAPVFEFDDVEDDKPEKNKLQIKEMKNPLEKGKTNLIKVPNQKKTKKKEKEKRKTICFNFNHLPCS